MIAVYELSTRRRRIRSKAAESLTEWGAVSSPDAAARFFRSRITHDDREHFMALYLDTRNRPIAFETLAIGTATEVQVDPKAMLRSALICGAVAIVVAHNHPSGIPDPSVADCALTDRLKDAAEICGFALLDHLIVTDTSATAWSAGWNEL